MPPIPDIPRTPSGEAAAIHRAPTTMGRLVREGAVIRRAWMLIWDADRSWIVVTVVLMACGSVYAPLALWITKESINLATVASKHSVVSSVGLVYFLFGNAILMVAMGLFREWASIRAQRRSARICVRLEHGLMLAVHRCIPLAEFERQGFLNQHRAAERAASGGLVATLRDVMALAADVVTLGTVGALSASVAAGLTAIVLPCSLLVLFVNWKNARESRRHLDLHGAEARRAQYWKSVLLNPTRCREIRALSLAGALNRLWAGAAAACIELEDHLWRGRFRRTATSGVVSNVSFGVTFGVSLLDVAGGRLELGSALMLNAALSQLVGCLSSVSTRVSRIWADSRDIHELVALLGSSVDRSKAPKAHFPRPLCTGISLSEVSFTFPGDTARIIDNVSLHIPSGQTVALVGPNGSGKTTLLLLIAGLYQPRTGSIRYDDIDVDGIDDEELSSNVTMLLQPPGRYCLSVRENVCLGVDLAAVSAERYLHAVNRVSLSEVVRRLPSGEETLLGQELPLGSELSAGEWQRVALARTLYRQQSVLLLDEPTTTLDERGRFVFQQFLKAKPKDLTVVFVSHDPSLIRVAQSAVYLERGHLVERGKHDDLVLREGPYSRLFTGVWTSPEA